MENGMKTLYRLFLAAFVLSFMVSMNAQAESLMEINDRAGKAFLEKNAQLEGVKTTASGLQYKVIKEGSGKRPGPRDVVTVNYEGRHLNGEVFDSSYKRNKPLEFPLNRVIKGWTEGLQLMQEGAKYQLYIPANLAYGTTGAGQAIGPEETLIFDVELIKVGR
jgi:FKBP-type peptidyl-prolyl cis-trans isomerase